ncbi:hypothetical protein Bca52824_007776 [Brassica carinata]|uniref:CCHC-type domain-containing protein n=1 Tax=Brassica carinata TaxID=52824 RepID=A0A8X7WAM7_BRACI|nr:hypothetical protein Bca52824_007776 [Brassica carinata]
MARLQGASKSSSSVRSLQKSSSLAGAPCTAAEITTEVVEVADSPVMALPAEECQTGSASGTQLMLGSSTSDLSSPGSLVSEQGLTSIKDEERNAGAAPATPKVPSSPQVPEVKNYAKLLKASAQLEELGTPTEHISGVPFVLIPDENIVAAKEEFRDFIYARFHGEYPAMGRIIGVVNAIWAKTGPRIFVHNIGEGAYLLRVTNEKIRESMLARTCWNVAGYPMFVAPWSPEFTPEEAPITSAVVPVELRNVPYLLFNQESLSRLATAVGKPVSLAPETERKENFQVAKLYVRVDLTKSLPRKIISGFSNGRENEIAVSYPWLPMKCEECGKYGHLIDKCRMRQSNSRQRSASPPGTGNRTRKRSRHGRTRRPLQNATPQDPVSNDTPPKLEDGEIQIPASVLNNNVPPELVNGAIPQSPMDPSTDCQVCVTGKLDEVTSHAGSRQSDPKNSYKRDKVKVLVMCFFHRICSY